MTRKPKNFAATIPANQSLQAKAGTGNVPSSTIKKCQDLLDNNTYDFSPIGQSMLDRLHSLIEKTHKGTLPADQATDKILECIMQLKANGSMFHYPLVSTLCAIVMEFIETYSRIDQDALSIIEVLHSNLSTVFDNKIKKNEREKYKHFETELKQMCLKYKSVK